LEGHGVEEKAACKPEKPDRMSERAASALDEAVHSLLKYELESSWLNIPAKVVSIVAKVAS